MNILEYQRLAGRTYPDLGSFEKNHLHLQLGVISEFGELLDVFKKNIAYNKSIDYTNISEEIADICWYLVNEATLIGQGLRDFKITQELRLPQEDVITHLIRCLLAYLNKTLTIQVLLENLWYITEFIGLDFEKGLENNINKLKVRYPEKFDSEKALNRNLEEERKELSK
jgi:NTP pyrophosphatase (non-canonical NTP hydrolase)